MKNGIPSCSLKINDNTKDQIDEEVLVTKKVEVLKKGSGLSLPRINMQRKSLQF